MGGVCVEWRKNAPAPSRGTRQMGRFRSRSHTKMSSALGWSPRASNSQLFEVPLSGAPDVVFFDRMHGRLYVAIGKPGSIDVFDTKTMEKLGSIATEEGAHTI